MNKNKCDFLSQCLYLVFTVFIYCTSRDVDLTEKPQNGVEVEVGKHINSILHLLQVYGNASNIYVLICCS